MSGRDLFTEGRRFSADDQARVSWRVDPWDDPDEVPVVEVPPRRGLLLRWVVGAIALTLIASVLAANGAKVALLDLPAAHASLQQRASALGGGAIALGCDVTNEASVMQAVAALERQLGACEILVNNAA
ncbi:MAG: SDR family oxidoreductase, partial [Ilumatobacteraceae bacterium]